MLSREVTGLDLHPEKLNLAAGRLLGRDLWPVGFLNFQAYLTQFSQTSFLEPTPQTGTLPPVHRQLATLSLHGTVLPDCFLTTKLCLGGGGEAKHSPSLYRQW